MIRILLTLTVLVFSSNALAEQCKVTRIDSAIVSKHGLDIKGLSKGSVYKPHDLVTSMWISVRGRCDLYYKHGRRGSFLFIKGMPHGDTCPLPNIPNETTGECEPPPDTGFCKSSEYMEIVASEYNACISLHPKHFATLTHRCESRENYSFTCNKGFPKGGGGNGGNGGNGGSGGGNSGGKTDLSGVIDKLNKSNQSTDSLSKSAVDQLEQDLKHHQENKEQADKNHKENKEQADKNHKENKELTLTQTKAIEDSATKVSDAIGTQTGALSKAIGDQTGALTNALNNLADKIPAPCEPNLDNDYCENPHGLHSGVVGNLFTQMEQKTIKDLDEANVFISDSLQKVIDNPLTNDAEASVKDSTAFLIDALGYSASCSPLVFVANGKKTTIDCDVSKKIKLILSFLIGMYTLMTLTDILLEGITPLGRKSSPTRFA